MNDKIKEVNNQQEIRPSIQEYIKLESNNNHYKLFEKDGSLVFDSSKAIPPVALKNTPEQIELLKSYKNNNIDAIKATKDVFISLITHLLDEMNFNNLKISNNAIYNIEIPINIPYIIKINETD